MDFCEISLVFYPLIFAIGHYIHTANQTKPNHSMFCACVIKVQLCWLYYIYYIYIYIRLLYIYTDILLLVTKNAFLGSGMQKE